MVLSEAQGQLYLLPLPMHIMGPMLGSCEHSNEHLGSIRSGKFLDQLSDYKLLKDSSPLS